MRGWLIDTAYDAWNCCKKPIEMFAALSIEEVNIYVQTRQPAVEIMELKVHGKVLVLSTSERLIEVPNACAVRASSRHPSKRKRPASLVEEPAVWG